MPLQIPLRSQILPCNGKAHFCYWSEGAPDFWRGGASNVLILGHYTVSIWAWVGSRGEEGEKEEVEKEKEEDEKEKEEEENDNMEDKEE